MFHLVVCFVSTVLLIFACRCLPSNASSKELHSPKGSYPSNCVFLETRYVPCENPFSLKSGVTRMDFRTMIATKWLVIPYSRDFFIQAAPINQDSNWTELPTLVTLMA